MAQYLMPISDAMRADVDLILNDAVPDDATNRSSIEITERPDFGFYRVYCLFYGDDRTTETRFDLEPFEINSLTITQNFADSFADEIILNVSLTAWQLLQLYDNSRGLKCVLQFTRCERNGPGKDEAPCISKEYLVIFKYKADVRKKYSKAALVPDTEGDWTNQQQDVLFQIEFQLIEDTVYYLRRVKFNYILRKVTVKDAILTICKICNITSIGLTEPDNTRVYDNFVIPPSMSFDMVINYIQSYYGIYNKGISYYFVDGVFYIYPAYETKPDSPASTHFYYVGNNYMGLDVTYALSNNITYIVLAEFAKSHDVQDEGAETLGTAYIVQDADRVIDHATIISENSTYASTGLGAVTVNSLNTSFFTADDNDIGMDDQTYQPNFIFDDSNPYRVRTMINQYRRTTLSTVWNNAQPWSLLPGYLVYYHYDGEDIEGRDSDDNISASAMYTTYTGICESVVYTFKQTGRLGPDHIFACDADLQLSLAYTPANDLINGESSLDTGSTTSSGTETSSSDRVGLF